MKVLDAAKSWFRPDENVSVDAWCGGDMHIIKATGKTGTPDEYEAGLRWPNDIRRPDMIIASRRGHYTCVVNIWDMEDGRLVHGSLTSGREGRIVDNQLYMVKENVGFYVSTAGRMTNDDAEYIDIPKTSRLTYGGTKAEITTGPDWTFIPPLKHPECYMIWIEEEA